MPEAFEPVAEGDDGGEGGVVGGYEGEVAHGFVAGVGGDVEGGVGVGVGGDDVGVRHPGWIYVVQPLDVGGCPRYYY